MVIVYSSIFRVDAYSYTRASYRRKMYCDLFTDIGNGRIYCVFTKDRSSKELISQTSILFALHPSWQQRHENTDRFFRLDPENNYCSEAFKQTASAFGYHIEPTAPRDKHENGIAERSVGIIAVKTNIAKLNLEPSVPERYWCLAMEYACDTHSLVLRFGCCVLRDAAALIEPEHAREVRHAVDQAVSCPLLALPEASPRADQHALTGW
jgi:hypothetical protein